MEVKLLIMTPNPIDVMWTAARTCYSAEGPITIWDNKYGEIEDGYDHSAEYCNQCTEKHWELVKKVLESGHESIAESVYFTFAIQDVSRVLLAQLTRHRAGVVFNVQSQRYVDYSDKFLASTIPDSIVNNKEATDIYMNVLEKSKEAYDKLVDLKIPAEDARYVLPNATCTNITMSVNLRELMHICNLRLCTRAQEEIRELFGMIKLAVELKEPRLSSLLVPNCEKDGFCKEHKCCGRKPKLKKILEVYKENKK